MKPRNPHFHFDILSGLKRPNMKKIHFTNPKHVDEFIKNHSNDFVHTKNGKKNKYTFNRSPEWRKPFDGNHWHCHLKIDEQKYDKVITQYDLNCRLNDITQIFIKINGQLHRFDAQWPTFE